MMLSTATTKAVLAFTFLTLVLPAHSAPIANTHLAAHRAVYALSLGRSEARSGLNDVQGKLVMEVTGSDCDGWTSNMRVVNRLDGRTGKSSVLDTRSTSWESPQGDTMEFASQRFNNGNQELDLRGQADTSAEGGSLHLELPAESEAELPPGTIFPVQHTRRILDAALQGEPRDRSIVYDGNEDQKILTAVTFIGKRNAPDTVKVETQAAQAQELAKLPSWPVSIGYFENTVEPDQAGEQMPEHQVNFLMFENAVATNLTLDYGDFTLKGDLVSLDYLPQETCAASRDGGPAATPNP
jgi:hypothetical protein